MPDLSTSPAQSIAGSQSPFRCSRSDGDGTGCIAVGGELDITTVPRLDGALRGAQADRSLVVLDLRELDFVDSSGARFLVAAARRIRRAGGRLMVVRGVADVMWFLELLGVDRELELVDQPPAATTAPRAA